MEELIKPARKRRKYFHYDDETRAKIGKHVAEHGNKLAVNNFNNEKFAKGNDVDKRIVRNFKRQFRQKLKPVGTPML